MRRTSPLPALLAFAVACTGVIDDPAGSGGGPGGSDVPGRTGGNARLPDGTCDVSLPPGAFERLTRQQYDYTVFDLVGDDTRPARGFAPDDNTDGFEVGLTVSPLLAEQYFDAAEQIAERVVLDLDALLPCDPATAGEDACASTFIRYFGPRAWRRPLSADELSRFDALYASIRAGYDFRTAIQIVVQAALASPWFNYHAEPVPEGTAPGAIVPVTGYAMANRLSYLIWSSMPDDELFAAAEAGELETPEQIEAQARRMLDDPKARRGMADFYRQWLGLDRMALLEKDEAMVPEFDAQLAQDLHDALAAYMDWAVWESDGTVQTLLLGNTTFMTPAMASLYGVDGVSSGLEPVVMDSPDRHGLLTQPALLALLAKPNQSDPIHRGLFVRERLFCQHLPPPPDDIVIRAPDPEPGLSTRERFAEHSANERCAGCHQLIDPIGFGFEAYDAVGRHRTTDQGVAVDDSGEVFSTLDADGPFDGVPGLSERLAGSEQVHECVAKQLFRFSVGRTETTRDACSLEILYEAGRSSDWNVRAILAALTQTDAFLFRIAPEGGDL
jgi:hypothetical protein